MAFNRIAFFVLVALTPLLFTTVSSPQSLLEKRLWDLGHLPFFMLLTFAFLPYAKQKIKKSKSPFLVVFQLFVFVFGLAASSEILQLMVDRKASFSDLRKDTLGIFIICQAYLLLNVATKEAWKVSWLITFLWCLFELLPVSEALLDRWRMRQSMPNLASFETNTELLRWGEGVYERYPSDTLRVFETGAQDPEKPKNHVLKIALNTNRFTGIVGTDLFHDWSGYNAFQFDVYNPNNYILNLNVKVEDTSSMDGMAYHNRYNGVRRLHSGPNRITIPFDEITSAPQGREMDIAAIRRLSLFFYALPESSYIYLDNVVLVK
jgi:hypothetical protein